MSKIRTCQSKAVTVVMLECAGSYVLEEVDSQIIKKGVVSDGVVVHVANQKLVEASRSDSGRSEDPL